MTHQSINLNEKLGMFSQHWSPKIIGRMNDYHLKLVKIQGEFIWHKHDETDEVFIVLDGSMEIHMRDGSVTLEGGEMLIVPKGVEHKPRAASECSILLIEPAGTVNTGDAGGELTSLNTDWI
jgi:mannose-6-phosphate isomerase-like protein (cupin superfamily)